MAIIVEVSLGQKNATATKEIWNKKYLVKSYWVDWITRLDSVVQKGRRQEAEGKKACLISFFKASEAQAVLASGSAGYVTLVQKLE